MTKFFSESSDSRATKHNYWMNKSYFMSMYVLHKPYSYKKKICMRKLHDIAVQSSLLSFGSNTSNSSTMEFSYQNRQYFSNQHEPITIQLLQTHTYTKQMCITCNSPIKCGDKSRNEQS